VKEMENLLLRLKNLNINLWLDKDTGELRFKAPKGALSPDLREELKLSKQHIIDFLRDINKTHRPADETITKEDRSAGMPLSFAQQRLWFLYQMEGKSAAYNIPSCRRLVGKLDVDILERSLNLIVHRHESLRTNFAVKGAAAEQIIAGKRHVSVPETDLRDLDKDAQEAETQRHIEAETGHCFELESEPLVRLALIRLSAQEYILTLVMHHIVSDGWSLEIFVRELVSAYRSLAAQNVPELVEMDIQYADFAIWQRRWFDEGGMSRQLDSWRQRLADVPQLLELPADRPRPAVQSFQGGVEFFTIERPLKEYLEVICKQENASLFMGLCAVFNCLIHRYTGREDIVTGTHTAGRTRKEQEALIGFFINTLPLRVDLLAGSSFRDVLRVVVARAREAFSHQDVPFEKLVELAQPERNMSHAPLVQVMCVLQNMPVGDPGLEGIRTETVPLARDTSKFDLSLLMEESTHHIGCEFEYNGDLFDAARIQRMATHFTMLLGGLVEFPDRSIGDHDLLDPEQSRQILGDFCKSPQPEHELPVNGNIVRLFEEQVDIQGDALAVSHDGENLSYDALNAHANQLAHYLVAQGLSREDVVALCMENSTDTIVAMLAVLKAGGCYLPMETDYPEERIAFLLGDANVSMVLSKRGSAGKFKDLKNPPSCLISIDQDWSEISAHPAQNLALDIDPEQLAYIIYTSGSSGEPKGVMIEHRGVVDLVVGLAGSVYLNCREKLRVALIASTVFDASVQQIFGTLLQGHSLHLIDKELKRDGAGLVDFLRDSAVDLCDGTPTLLAVMVASGLLEAGQNTPQRFIIGGEPLPPDLADMLAWKNIAVSNAYGPTECCVDAIVHLVKAGSAPCSGVPIGRPIGRCRAYILDAHGKPVPVGVNGELHLSGAGLFRGYVNKPELTAAKRVANPFLDDSSSDGERDVYGLMYRTGDICHWLADGEIAIVGRNDDQVKIRGYLIEPAEIEAHLCAHQQVNEALVLPRQSAQGVQELAAYLTFHDELDIPTLHGYLEERIPQYMIPAAFYQVAEMPINKSGKIDRKALAASSAERASLSRGAQHVAPRNEREETLCALFATILAVEDVGVRDNFFFLGGDSIKALQVAARLHQQNLHLEIRNLFLHPTVEALAPTLAEVQQTSHSKTDFTGQLPMTAVQRWFFENYADPGQYFNQSVLLRASQPLDAAALGAALKAVVAHHDALRLRFVKQGDGYVQQYGEPAHGFEVADCADGENPERFLEERTTALQRQVDLEGPTVQAGLYGVGDGQRLFIAIHHLVVDTVSWRQIFDDLDGAYRQAVEGQQVSLPPSPVSFGQWAEAIGEYANAAVLGQLDYWQGVEQSAPAVDASDDAPSVNCLHGDCAVKSVRLSAAMTGQLLTEANEAYNTGIDDLLLAALARTLADWRGQQQTVVMLEGHGREDVAGQPGVGATVGWFTSIYPVVLTAHAQADTGGHIKAIKEHLRGIPDKGIGYGILRYLSDREHLKGDLLTAAPDISFNYLGRFEASGGPGLFTLSDDKAAANIDPASGQPFPLEIVGMVHGDTLEISAGYSTKHYTGQSIERLLQTFSRELLAIVDFVVRRDERELTPSDIDYDGFDQQGLDAFIEAFSNDDAVSVEPLS
jgi:amino acid adenylation domain-containing protein/non-ribosomal peptide synthase protein (TIGR01720 family)